jgi:hypothetical protein
LAFLAKERQRSAGSDQRKRRTECESEREKIGNSKKNVRDANDGLKNDREGESGEVRSAEMKGSIEESLEREE